jgi:hypothetical protein
MKSKLFQNNSTPAKKFSEHLKIIANLDIPNEMLNILVESITQYTLAITGKEETKALEELREKWPQSLEETKALIGIGGYLLRKWETEDSVDEIMEDLDSLAIVEHKNLSKMRPLIEAICEESKKRFSTQILAVSTQNSILKNILSIGHVVDLRGMIINPPEVGDCYEEYVPNIKQLVPVGIVQLKITGDKVVRFQLNLKTLKILKDDLTALEKELNVAIDLVGNEKVHLGRS